MARGGSDLRPEGRSYLQIRSSDRQVAPAFRLEIHIRIKQPRSGTRAKDGTRVSMFLVHRADLPRDGDRPVLLSGYGGFNINRTPAYDPGQFSAARSRRHLRAGEPARRRRVRRGVASGRHARAEAERLRRLHRGRRVPDRGGLHAPERLAIEGGSNGGLLVGAVMTAAAGAVRRGALPRAGRRHAALSPVHHRPLLDPRVRLRRRSGAVRVPARVLAVPQRASRASAIRGR